MVFDAEAGQLIGLENSAQTEVVQSNITDSEDVLIFPVEENTETALSVDELPLESQPVMATEQAVSVIDEPVAEIAVELPANAVASTQEDFGNLMPQDILKLREQSLEGEWNLEKWEYWFRTSQLSPAVQELAQHGIMQGQINGASIFLIPQEYEGMLSQLQHGLEDALKAQWPQTHFNVQYGAVDSNTPLLMQNQRKQKAFNRAVELLQQEPTIKSLVETFDAELHNIQLKP